MEEKEYTKMVKGVREGGLIGGEGVVGDTER